MPAIELATLRELFVELGSDHEILCDLLFTFETDLKSHQAELQRLISNEPPDEAAIRLIAHTLKGSCSTMGAHEASRLAQTLDSSLRSEDPVVRKSALSTVPLLLAQLDQTINAARALRENPPAELG